MEELKICRFCLTKEDPKADLQHLFSGSLGSIQVWSLSCTGIELCEGTEVAPFICTTCLQLMEAFHQFKQICKKTDTALKMYFMTKNLPEAFELPLEKLSDIVSSKSSSPPKETNDAVCQASILPRTMHKAVQVRFTNDEKSKKVSTSPNKLQKKNTTADIQSVKGKSEEPKIGTKTRTSTRQRHTNEDIEFIEISSRDLSTPIEPTQPKQITTRPLETKKLKLPEKSQSSNEQQKNLKRTLEESATISIDKRSTELLEIHLEPPKKVPKKTVQKLKKESHVAAAANKPKLLNQIINPSGRSSNEVKIKTLTIDNDNANVAIELNTEEELSIFPCEYCDRTFVLRQQLEIHEQTHFRARNYSCDLCESRFLSKHDLSKHMFSHAEKMFVCQICQKSFSRNIILKTHQEREHSQYIKFACDQCDKRFLEAEELQQHIKAVHSRERRFKCGDCDKQFAFKQGLERHSVVHNTTEHDNVCEHCGEAFLTANKLSRHLLATHTGKRRYPCKYCAKTFLLSHHRSRHMKGHINGTLRETCKPKDDSLSFTLTEVPVKYYYKSVSMKATEEVEDVEAMEEVEDVEELLPGEVDYVEIEEFDVPN